jgi:hypothetical protein
VTVVLWCVPGTAGTGAPFQGVALAKFAAVIALVEYRMSNDEAVPVKLSSPGVVHESWTLFHVTVWAAAVPTAKTVPRTESRTAVRASERMRIDPPAC